MHGLINRSIENFVRSCYGGATWREVVARIGMNKDSFSSFRPYPDEVTERLTAAVAECLDRPEEELLEDVGAWLARVESVRRLLRFSGSDYSDFVIALEELPGRARMVLPELEVPGLSVQVSGPEQYRIHVIEEGNFWKPMISGLLRAMSDDYGALTLIVDEGDTILVDVSDASFGEGRDFSLAGRPRMADRRSRTAEGWG